MTISIDTLSAFVEVAKHLSVSSAANALGIPKSAVSKRVASLEGSVNTTLFSRSTRKIALTNAGDIYLDFAQRTVAQALLAQENMQDLLADTGGALSGKIRLTAPVSWGQQVLAKYLPAFVAQHRGLEIELQLSDRMMDLAYERFDLALRWSVAPLHGLASEPIAYVDWIYVASPAYLAQAGIPAQPNDLVHHSCMCYWQENADDAWRMQKVQHNKTLPLEELAVRVISRFHANNPETVTHAAIAGCGIALLPSYACTEALKRKKLVRVLRGWTPLTKFGVQITAVATPECMRIVRIKTLVSYLRLQMGEAIS
jgi:DNA-binding transcriptional LysR family regulator